MKFRYWTTKFRFAENIYIARMRLRDSISPLDKIVSISLYQQITGEDDLSKLEKVFVGNNVCDLLTI